MPVAPSLKPAVKRRVLLPFALVTLLWGGTWIVIRHQIGVAPPGWSITYRFVLASIAMFAYLAVARLPLRLAARDHGFAAVVGAALFCCNFHFVYRAEAFITSGLVALVFATLLVPNTLLARLFLGQTVSRPFFIGSAVALAGLALLFWHELSTSPVGPRNVAAGIALTLGAVLSASAANVMQATERARRLSGPTLLAWAMTYGAMADAIIALLTDGAPRLAWDPGYLLGLGYLGIMASAVAFPLYFGVIQAIGPGRAAYSSVLVPVLAMALSTVFEGYRWTLPGVAGVMLVLGGLVVALRGRVG